MATDGGLRFEVLLMEVGPIPPSGGPNRDRYLETKGRKALSESDDALASVLTLLGPLAKDLPELYIPLVIADETHRRKVQREKRTEWLEFGDKVAPKIREQIEPSIRKAESTAVAALNFLEDHELAECAHEAIHRTAFVRRGLFGCPIVLRDDGSYWTDCSINLSHIRAGMSAELISDFECTLCGELVEDCEHQVGQGYDAVASQDANGECSICRSIACGHEVGQTYPVAALATARNVVAEAVAMVARPRYPQARMVKKTIDLGAEDQPFVRRAAEAGALHCDVCLGPCKGFNDMRTWGELSSDLAQVAEDSVQVDAYLRSDRTGDFE